MKKVGPTSSVIVFLEHPSLLEFKAVRRYLRDGMTLAIFEPFQAKWAGGFSPDESESILRRYGKTLEGIRVRWITNHEYFGEMVWAGEEAIETLEREEERIRASYSFRVMRHLLGSDAVLLAMKKGMVSALADRIHFFKMAALLAEESESHVIAVPAFFDVFGLAARYWGSLGTRVVVPRDVRGVLRRIEMKRWLRSLLHAVRSFAVRPGAITMRPIAAPRCVTWARPISAGFSDETDSGKLTFRTDDNLEDGGAFRPSEFLYIHHFWRFSREKILAWRARLESKGAGLVDMRELKINLGFYFKHKLRANWAELKSCLSVLGHFANLRFHEPVGLIRSSYVESELFMRYFRPKVCEVRDEYNLGHIIRTLVFNKYGCKTIGIDHGVSVCPGLYPYMAYTYCDTFCAYGPASFDTLFPKVWSHNKRRVCIGVERNDYAYRAVMDRERFARFRRRARGRRVIAWFPPGVHIKEINPEEKVREVLLGLGDFLRARSGWLVLVKPRRPSVEYFRDRLATFGAVEPWSRVCLEEEFSSYDLIAYSEIIIAANVSSVGVEAICAGKDRVVIYNYWSWVHPLTHYSERLVASSPAELCERLDGFVRDDGSVAPEALARVRKDFDVGFDGQALRRYKHEMLLLAGVDS